MSEGPRGRGARGNRRARGRGAGRGAGRGGRGRGRGRGGAAAAAADVVVASNGHNTTTTDNPETSKIDIDEKSPVEASEENTTTTTTTTKPKTNKPNNQPKKRNLKEMESEDVPMDGKEDKIQPPPAKRPKHDDKPKPTNQIIIANLPYDITEEDVSELIQKKAHETPKSVQLVQEIHDENDDDKKSANAFVVFEDPSKVEGIVDKLTSLPYKDAKVSFTGYFRPGVRSDLKGVSESVAVFWNTRKVSSSDILAALAERRCQRKDGTTIVPKGQKDIYMRKLKALLRIDFENAEDAKIVQEALDGIEVNSKYTKGNFLKADFWAKPKRSKKNKSANANANADASANVNADKQE